jgi:hypothetical protein
MARIVFILGILLFAATLGPNQAAADAGDGHSFAWFRDADGDGIPNGMDEDWLRPEDGSGYQVKNQFGLYGFGLVLGNGDGGYVYGPQYRYRKNQPDTLGDFIRLRQQLRDGSCK